MFDKGQQVFTTTLVGTTLIIKAEYGITVVAMKLTAGAGSYKGTKSLGVIPSTANPLAVDKSVTISSEISKYLDEVIIDATAGTIEIIAR